MERSIRAVTRGFGGLRLDNFSLCEAVAVIGRAVEGAVRGYVVTPNVDHVVRYQRDSAFRAAYDAAIVQLADGRPVVWAARLLGWPLKARVAGADLLPAICRWAAERRHSVFLLGGAEDVAKRAADRLSGEFLGLAIAGTYTPPYGFSISGPASEAALEAVNRARPDILFVGLGSPKQELWVHRHWDRLATTVAICCGAAIDYAAGAQPRAPAWMQRVGLEWFWRLAHEPRRLWRRYLVEDAAFVGIVLKEWWRLRVKGSR